MRNIQERVYWSTVSYNNWQLYLAATDIGLCYVTLPNESLDTLRQWVQIHIPEAWMTEDASKLGQYQDQWVEYERGEGRVATPGRGTGVACLGHTLKQLKIRCSCRKLPGRCGLRSWTVLLSHNR